MPNFGYDFAGAGAVVADSLTVTNGITATSVTTTGDVTVGGDIDAIGAVTAPSFTGNLTGDSTGAHTGDVTITDAAQGLKFGGASGIVVQAPPPNTNAEFEALTGLSGAWWRHDRTISGDLISQGDTSATLADAGSPTFSAHCGPRIGVHYDASTGDAHSADVLDAAEDSFICGGRFAFLTDPSGTNHALIGRVNATAANGWIIHVTDAGNVSYRVNDGTTLFSASPAALNALMTLAGEPLDLVVQLDRSGAEPVLRIRASRNGASVGTASVTLTSCGTLTGASQEFGFGAIPVSTPVYNGGAWCQWAFYAQGAQAEGANVAQTVSQALGFE